MKIIINNRELEFSFVGFGPLYIYETLQGEVFTGELTRNVHMLIYSTLFFCNREEGFSMNFDEFSAWLYEHPEEEGQMTSAIAAEVERRNSLRAKKKE